MIVLIPIFTISLLFLDLFWNNDLWMDRVWCTWCSFVAGVCAFTHETFAFFMFAALAFYYGTKLDRKSK